MEFESFNEFLNYLRQDIQTWPEYNRTENGQQRDYKNSIKERTQFFYTIKDATNIIATNKTFYQYPFWVVSELLSEIFALNPPIMYKYKPETIEWAYKIKVDKSTEYAYGRRWQEWNQLLNVIELLSKRHDSKRAVIDIFTPYDTDVNRADTPCTLMYTFKIRNNKLNMTTFFRSHDLFAGSKYDIILSSFINQLICMCINAKNKSNVIPGALGTYEDSLHIYYLKDQDKLQQLNKTHNMPSQERFNIMHNYNDMQEVFDDLYYVLKVEESSYYGNFEFAMEKLNKIKNPAFKDFAKVYYNKNAKFNNKDLYEEYTTKVLKWKT